MRRGIPSLCGRGSGRADGDGALPRRPGFDPPEIRLDRREAVEQLGPAREQEHRGADEVGDGEATADEVVAVFERVLDHPGRVLEPRRRLGRAFAVLGPSRHQQLDDLRLELGHREHAPLVDERAFVRSGRRDQLRLRVQVGDVEQDRERLEDETLVVLDHRYAAERMPRRVRLPAPLVARHQRQVVGRTDLLE